MINHYNLFRSAEIDGSAAPGLSSGQAIEAMEELAEEVAAARAIPSSGPDFRWKKSDPAARPLCCSAWACWWCT